MAFGGKWTVEFRNKEENLLRNEVGVLLRSLDFIRTMRSK